ncbi:MAG: ABC transporter ATP-binding protein [Alphaproteobacteria bacterium]
MPAPTTPVVEVRGLTVALPTGADRPHAVEDINLSVNAGEILCLVGESGSGKSVTAQAIMGMLPRALSITAGEILVEGAPLPLGDSAAMEEIRGARIALIFQEPSAALNPIQRVGRQVEEVFTVHRVGRATERRDRVLALFASVQLPDPELIYRAYPHQLSGGQCQRVVIAMALALKPRLLIADEPTTALDVTTQAEILKLINELKVTQDAGILLITHDFGVVADVGDKIAIMRHGVIVEHGTRAEIFGAPKHEYTRHLLAAVPVASPKVEEVPDELPVALRVENVTRLYKTRQGLFGKREVKAVDKVSLTLHGGRTLGVVGESGSGKSTLARCILRLEPIDGGSIHFAGQEIADASEATMRPLRKVMQVVLQDPYQALNPRQRVGKAIAEGPVIHGESASNAAERTRHMLDLVGLSPQSADRYPHEFSGGQRQRICIARALALEPQLLIADEPVSSLDVSIQAQILELFEELQRKLGFALLFITHDLRVAASLCHEILVMQHGRVVEHRATNDLFNAPREAYTRALLNAAPGKGMNFSAVLARSAAP